MVVKPTYNDFISLLEVLILNYANKACYVGVYEEF